MCMCAWWVEKQFIALPPLNVYHFNSGIYTLQLFQSLTWAAFLHPAPVHTWCRPAVWLWSPCSWVGAVLGGLWPPPLGSSPPLRSYCLLQEPAPPRSSPSPRCWPSLDQPSAPLPPSPLCPSPPPPPSPPPHPPSSLPGQPGKEKLVTSQWLTCWFKLEFEWQDG